MCTYYAKLLGQILSSRLINLNAVEITSEKYHTTSNMSRDIRSLSPDLETVLLVINKDFKTLYLLSQIKTKWVQLQRI